MYGKQILDALRSQLIGSSLGNLREALKLGVLRHYVLLGARVGLLKTSQTVLFDLLVLVLTSTRLLSLLSVGGCCRPLSWSLESTGKLALYFLITSSEFCKNH